MARKQLINDGETAAPPKRTRKKSTRKPTTKKKAAPTADQSLRLEYVEAGSLTPNPRNWRTHPPEQARALKAAIDQVGWAGAILVNETTGHVLDGHLRLESAAPEQLVPVLIGQWTQEQERKILLTHDPIGAMAEADTELLQGLIDDTDLEGDLAAVESELNRWLSDEADAAGGEDDDDSGDEDASGDGGEASGGQQRIEQAYQVLVQCSDEADQAAVFERLKSEGYKCRVLTLY